MKGQTLPIFKNKYQVDIVIDDVSKTDIHKLLLPNLENENVLSTSIESVATTISEEVCPADNLGVTDENVFADYWNDCDAGKFESIKQEIKLDCQKNVLKRQDKLLYGVLAELKTAMDNNVAKHNDNLVNHCEERFTLTDSEKIVDEESAQVACECGITQRSFLQDTINTLSTDLTNFVTNADQILGDDSIKRSHTDDLKESLAGVCKVDDNLEDQKIGEHIENCLIPKVYREHCYVAHDRTNLRRKEHGHHTMEECDPNNEHPVPKETCDKVNTDEFAQHFEQIKAVHAAMKAYGQCSKTKKEQYTSAKTTKNNALMDDAATVKSTKLNEAELNWLTAQQEYLSEKHSAELNKHNCLTEAEKKRLNCLHNRHNSDDVTCKKDARADKLTCDDTADAALNTCQQQCNDDKVARLNDQTGNYQTCHEEEMQCREDAYQTLRNAVQAEFEEWQETLHHVRDAFDNDNNDNNLLVDEFDEWKNSNPPSIDADMDGVDDSESPVGFNLDTDVDDIDGDGLFQDDSFTDDFIMRRRRKLLGEPTKNRLLGRFRKKKRKTLQHKKLRALKFLQNKFLQAQTNSPYFKYLIIDLKAHTVKINYARLHAEKEGDIKTNCDKGCERDTSYDEECNSRCTTEHTNAKAACEDTLTNDLGVCENINLDDGDSDTCDNTRNAERSACESTFDDAKADFDAKKQQKENAYNDAVSAANTEYNNVKATANANYVNALSNIDTCSDERANVIAAKSAVKEIDPAIQHLDHQTFTNLRDKCKNMEETVNKPKNPDNGNFVNLEDGVRLGDQLSVYDVFFEWYKQENEHSYCDDQGKLYVDRRLESFPTVDVTKLPEADKNLLYYLEREPDLVNLVKNHQGETLNFDEQQMTAFRKMDAECRQYLLEQVKEKNDKFDEDKASSLARWGSIDVDLLYHNAMLSIKYEVTPSEVKPIINALVSGMITSATDKKAECNQPTCSNDYELQSNAPRTCGKSYECHLEHHYYDMYVPGHTLNSAYENLKSFPVSIIQEPIVKCFDEEGNDDLSQSSQRSIAKIKS